MNPEEETRFAEAFTDLGDAAELMVEPPEAAVIRRRVRRRRTTRVTVAAVAALALLAPASWMLQQAATAEERPPAADDATVETTADAAPPTSADPAPSTSATPDAETQTLEAAPPPSFDDLVGQSLGLPAFGDGMDAECPTAPAHLTAAGGDGPVLLLKVVHARLTADGPVQAVALVGCAPGEGMRRQVLVIEADGDGYAVAQQLYRHERGENASVYDIAPDAGHGLLLGFLSEEPCCATQIQDVEQWVERYRDGEFEELTGEVAGTHITDLAATVELVGSGEGTREVEVTVTNLGENDAAQFTLSICSTEAIRLQGEDSAACDEVPARVETVGGLGAGDSYETTWTIEVDPREEWPESGASYGQEFVVTLQMPGHGTDALVLETNWDNNSAQHIFAYDGTD